MDMTATGPVPFGLPVADMLAGATLCQGLLAALVGRGISGRGCHVETSLLEAILDLQFEVLTTYLNNGGRPPERSAYRSAHVGLAAPYGVYPTADGYLAIAMTPLDRLVELLDLPELTDVARQPDRWFTDRDAIKQAIARVVATKPTDHWLDRLVPHDIWCAKVMDWPELLSHPAFTRAGHGPEGGKREGCGHLGSWRSPLRLDGCARPLRLRLPRSGRTPPRSSKSSG